MDALARLNDLVPNPSCVYDALEPILASCETPENIAERTKISIQLSLCEFNAAHIDFPSLCYDSSQTIKCTQMLETRATWWTTFSGNYQHIPVICQEYKPHFESAQLLGVYKDASTIFQSYELELQQTLKEFHNAIATTTMNWQHIRNNLSREIEDASGKLLELQTVVNDYRTNEYVEQVSSLLAQTAEQLHGIAETKAQLDTTSLKIHSRLIRFEKSMATIESQHSKTAGLLQASALRTSEILSEVDITLRRILTAVSVVGATCKAFWAAFWPTILFATGCLLYVAWRRLRKEGHQPNFEKEQSHIDLIFY